MPDRTRPNNDERSAADVADAWAVLKANLTRLRDGDLKLTNRGGEITVNEDGSKTMTMPWWTSPVLDAVHRALYRVGAMETRNWPKALDGLVQTPEAIAAAPIEDVLVYSTAAIRGERFVLGVYPTWAKNGMVYEIVRRLVEYAETHTVDGVPPNMSRQTGRR